VRNAAKKYLRSTEYVLGILKPEVIPQAAGQ
jgi:hypothetical protein